MATVIGPRHPSDPDEPADDDATVLPELEDGHWMHRATEFAHTSFQAVARRLPALVREAVVLAWGTSRRDTVASIGLNVAAGVMTTLGLLATTGVLRQLFAAGPTPDRIRAALPALALAGLAVTVKGALTVAAGWAQARLIPQINYQVELRLFETTTTVELAAFDDAGFAEEMDRARDRGMAEAASIVDHTVNLLTGVVGVLATAAAVTVVQPVLLPCLLLAAVPEAVTAVRMARRQYLVMLARITRRRRMWMLANLMADRHTAAEVRAYQMRDFLLTEFRRMMAAETRAELRLARSQSTTRAVGMSATGIAAFGVYAVLGGLLLVDVVALAAAATALLALQSARSSLRIAVFATNSLYEDALYYQDYRDFLDRARQRVPVGGGRPVDGFDRIELDRVSLRYPDTATAAVDGVSLTIRRGEVIALVGENGSGKTTLAKLIAGLYRPTDGVIRWDGTDTAELDPRQTGAQVAVMTQDWWKFPFTAGQNIRIGRHDRPADRPGPSVEDAARGAAAHDMITGLPYGYDTLLDRQFKDGQDLSGGQWQRLVAARGLYRDARLLICDEPSAALDARAEHALFQHLRRHPERAVVLITHRLANVRHADRIFVMDHGRLVQQGDHDELMAQDGPYRELFELQAAGYLAGAGDGTS
ncbi:ATP-binding cassette subfamily B protein/ATP-binding cassette subfamily C protein [Micromonospora kangleipakensis]|uniref:ATP-binding cassette subfamily B protein/ATP-binding cassette subfamily C protein n=1 Tax=Micromonospora kangleipakensis TaxID=1077942 RepID=A0A4Q8BF64_9ACTN|nr:ABC transporter ATP-binding protein [Micromonospora kangleipakensis]RZU76600.1 ATP-binding cassette subfamily B protein/ATP-binding cassette subfamily C protein [Micromonospora kangleipakensis]